MAYDADITYERKVILGREHTIVTVVETEVVDNSHEFEVEAPRSGLGTITFHSAVLTAAGAGATATTVDPQVSESTGGTAFWENGAAAAETRSSPDERFKGSSLFFKSMSDGNVGATGNITTTIVFAEGHI